MISVSHSFTRSLWLIAYRSYGCFSSSCMCKRSFQSIIVAKVIVCVCSYTFHHHMNVWIVNTHQKKKKNMRRSINLALFCNRTYVQCCFCFLSEFHIEWHEIVLKTSTHFIWYEYGAVSTSLDMLAILNMVEQFSEFFGFFSSLNGREGGNYTINNYWPSINDLVNQNWQIHLIVGAKTTTTAKIVSAVFIFLLPINWAIVPMQLI